MVRGPFLELGAARIAATANAPDVTARDASGLAAATGLAVGIEGAPVEALRLRAEAEIGAAIASVEGRADSEPTPGYGGAFVGLTLQAGVAFW